ncbi:MAG TPA: acyl-CoA dehydrogenase family protein [Candidatus Limnocylindria bacterium]|nr:acyl-CoA dehydrogenase family protein [Candidatus Limnocylindria bacterium]
MRFALSEDQALLQRATREFFAAEFPMACNRRVMEADGPGFEPAGWARLAAMGYLGLTVPAARGGQGLGAVELAVVLEEAGRHGVPGPLLDVMLAAALLAAAPDDTGLLADVLAGRRLAVLARADALYAGAPGPAATFAGGRVRGTKYFVPFAGSADALLVTTAGEVVVAEGPFAAVPLPTFDPAQRFAQVDLDRAATRLGPLELLEPVDQLAAVGASAMLLGIMQTLLDTTIAYTRTRHAFGKPIAAFQALQHRMADMLVRTEATRAAVYRAAWCLDTRDPDAALACAAAKAWAGDAARLVAGEAIQMHGGIGFTWELDVHFHVKRVKTLEQHYGATSAQLERALVAAGY